MADLDELFGCLEEEPEEKQTTVSVPIVIDENEDSSMEILEKSQKRLHDDADEIEEIQNSSKKLKIESLLDDIK